MARTGRRIRFKILIVLAAAGAALFAYFGLPIRNDTGAADDIEKAILIWAENRNLIPNEEVGGRRNRRGRFVKWITVERSFWYENPKSRAALGLGLARLAESLGLEMHEEGGGRYSFVAVFDFPGGREAARINLWRRAIVALCIDDIGYQLKAVRRIAALPCPVTCAVIPFTPHARQAAELLSAAGKEIFLHMPMESVMPLPDVPEYGLAIGPGQDRVALAVCVDKALQEIPQAVGLNNHEGSLATEDWETMSGLMEVLRQRDLIFMDSATTSKTIAWKAAGAVGVKWAMRDIFIDHTLERSAIEHYFSELVSRARRDGRAIGVCHTHRKTLDMLERAIPRAMAEGVVFMPVSELTRSGMRRSRLSEAR